MTKHDILHVLHECSRRVGVELDSRTLMAADNIQRDYPDGELDDFIRDLTDLANGAGIMILRKEVDRRSFEIFNENFDAPCIFFIREGETIRPAVMDTIRKTGKVAWVLDEGQEAHPVKFDTIASENILSTSRDEVIFLSVFVHESIVGSRMTDNDEIEDLRPIARLYRFLKADKKDIFYVYIYAVLVGISGLVLPLGIQAAIELISGGVFFSSIYVLIAIIIIGVLGAGVLQVMQITIVEFLQRRVFTKAAFEFAFRVPRIKMEAVANLHLPELINRFFDVINLQKSLPKLLIDLSTGVIQILFGLILLSLYHPFFIFFGIGLITTLFLIFYFTGPKALKTSIMESKYKYKAVSWLEELARSINSFKLSGSTDLPIRKTDYYVNNYLKHRRGHFRLLLSQYGYILLFKAVITAGLLIIGTMLVVQREITLGQFVASEVIIILILSSVEKIISYLDVVYDMLTAVDKIAHVTDLPLENTGGVDIPMQDKQAMEGFKIELKNLTMRYPKAIRASISNIDLRIEARQRVCISGVAGSGRTTLTNVLAGLVNDYTGVLLYDGYSFRDLDKVHLRDRIGKNVSAEDIFEGTLLDNILVGKPNSTIKTAQDAIDQVGLADIIGQLPDGLNTFVPSGGKGFSETFIQKLILARCLAKRPNLLILNDFFSNFSKHERIGLIHMVTKSSHPWTLIAVSNDPVVMASCDRVLYLEDGHIIADGPYEKIMKMEEVMKNMN
jgi:ABC-type bacteriocin/lantibiotic exporter with double-glycine peptidase domain